MLRALPVCALLIMVAAFSLSTPRAQAQALAPQPESDEFVGPFPSWLNVQRDFGAKGDGVADDTEALQNALNKVGSEGHSPVLFLPTGTYLVKRPLILLGGIYLSLVGEDPGKTTIKWAGGRDATILQIAHVAYSRIIRLTFDGNGTAETAVSQSESATAATPSRQLFFATGNEYSDDVFENSRYGLRAGLNASGDAEGTILRCRFINNANVGFETENFNALDWWVWESFFYGNGTGVADTSGAYHVYDSVFRGSVKQDAFIFNTGNFNFRGNISLNSAAFMNTAYYYTNAAPTIVEANTIVSPTATKGYAIWQGLMGALTLIDNVFTTRAGLPSCSASGAGCVISEGAIYGADVLDVGNTYTVPNGILLSYGAATFGDPFRPPTVDPSGTFVLNRLLSLDSRVVAPSSLTSAPIRESEPLKRNERKVFEVPSGSTVSTIQAAILRAEDFCGAKPIVHIQYGRYSIDKSIVVPANCDMQIVGDGGATSLVWTGPTDGSVIVLRGPARATIREILVDDSSEGGTDILVENADQVGARVFMLEATLNNSIEANLFVDRLDNTYVESQDIEHAGAKGTSVLVIGGPNARTGTPRNGKTVLFGGSGAGNNVSFGVLQGGNLMVQDTWYEGSNKSTFATISDAGGSRSQFTIEGSRIALPAGNGPAFAIRDLMGNVTIMNNTLSNVVYVDGHGTGNVWVVGNTTDGTGAFPKEYETSSYLINDSLTTQAVFTTNRYQGPRGSLPDPDHGTVDAPFARSMLVQDRASRFSPLAELPVGVTDLRLYRVSTNRGKYGIHIQAF